MRTVLRSYEPVFGGLVAALAIAVLCIALFMPQDSNSHSPRMFSMMYSVTGISWGVLQIFGYRAAKRRHTKLEEPVLDTVLGCILVGLVLAVVAVFFLLFSQNVWYSIAIGVAAAILLAVGAIAGIRKGTWRSNT